MWRDFALPPTGQPRIQGATFRLLRTPTLCTFFVRSEASESRKAVSYQLEFLLEIRLPRLSLSQFFGGHHIRAAGTPSRSRGDKYDSRKGDHFYTGTCGINGRRAIPYRWVGGFAESAVTFCLFRSALGIRRHVPAFRRRQAPVARSRSLSIRAGHGNPIPTGIEGAGGTPRGARERAPRGAKTILRGPRRAWSSRTC